MCLKIITNYIHSFKHCLLMMKMNNYFRIKSWFRRVSVARWWFIFIIMVAWLRWENSIWGFRDGFWLFSWEYLKKKRFVFTYLDEHCVRLMTSVIKKLNLLCKFIYYIQFCYIIIYSNIIVENQEIYVFLIFLWMTLSVPFSCVINYN